jgi:hypothetical protein
MINNFRIVDGHVHTFPSEEVAAKVIEAFNNIYDIEFINAGTGSINDVLQNMEKIGIDYTVMTNFTTPRILHKNNLWTIDAAKNHSNLIPLISLHPQMEGQLRDFLEGYVNDGAKGIKLHPMAQGFTPADSSMDDVYSCCSEIGLPVVFHCGRVANARLNEYADLEMIMPVIERYPDIPIVLTHMVDGNIDDVLNLAKNYKNIYFDTSIVITGYPPIMNSNEPSWLDDSVVIDVVNTVGEERIVFGSDYPWGSPAHDIDRFMKMNLNHRQKSLILGENTFNLFKIQ